MEDELNEFVDFQGIFNFLITKHKKEMLEEIEKCAEIYKYETNGPEVLEKCILDFYENQNKYKYYIEKSECEFGDPNGNIVFIFINEQQDANESDTQNSWSSIFISYNRGLGFSDFVQEQG
jgi:hypothetical protein